MVYFKGIHPAVLGTRSIPGRQNISGKALLPVSADMWDTKREYAIFLYIVIHSKWPPLIPLVQRHTLCLYSYHLKILSIQIIIKFLAITTFIQILRDIIFAVFMGNLSSTKI